MNNIFKTISKFEKTEWGAIGFGVSCAVLMWSIVACCQEKADRLTRLYERMERLEESQQQCVPHE
jgi:hypothetical protein